MAKRTKKKEEVLMPVTLTNKDIVQSYIVTSSRYDFNVYEKRVMTRIIDFSQRFLNGEKLDHRINIQKSLFDDMIFKVPISAFLLGDDDKNHARIKTAFSKLESKRFIYEDDEVWEVIRLIQKPKIDKRSEMIEFELQPLIFNALMNFTKGYRKYELNVIMGFESVYSMRFYELMSGQKTRLTYRIETLKAMFQIENKYKQVNDFLRYVILPAQKELNEKSPYTFEYEPYKEGRKIVGFHFYPIYQPKFRDEDLERKELQKQVSPSWDLSQDIILYLEQNYYFDKTEIKRNIDLFKKAQHTLTDFIVWLANKRRTANTKKNPKGWLINAIKGELKAK